MIEKRKLTKADIDKVRGIEGFPIAKDEDIIALSDAPYYTACPNPFIEEFIRENGTRCDEASVLRYAHGRGDIWRIQKVSCHENNYRNRPPYSP